MLSDRFLQLLTASVDGELSSRQRRQVDRLLRHSPEARQVLRRLQEDARRLHELPQPALPRDLSEPVLQIIADRRVVPVRPRTFQPRAGVPAWKGLVAAAAVLLVLGLASYLYFDDSAPFTPGPVRSDNRASGDPGTNPAGPFAQERDKTRTPGVTPTLRNPGNTDPTPPTPSPVEKDPEPVEEPKVPEKPSEPEPDPKDSARPVLTDRGMELFKIETVELASPLVLPLTDLEMDATRQKLQTELGKSKTFRLELPVHDSIKAVERLQTASKAAGINLIVDQVAQGRLKKTPTPWKTNYVCYLETLTPADLTRLMQQLANVDRLAAAKKPAEDALDRLVVARMNGIDWRELSDLLGTTIQPLAEQGGAKPDSAKPASKGMEHTGLLLTLPPIRPNRNSAEIKRFLEVRKPAKPEAVRVLIVVRNVG